jgi:ribonuclease Z
VKVTFIGTGSGKTSLNRYHSSLLFSFNNYNLLVDAGDCISRALLDANIKYNSINGILFTHLHPDHFSGLGALIVQMKMHSRTDMLQIYVHNNLVEDIKNYLISCNLLSVRMNFEIQYKPFNDNEEFFVNKELKILPRENSHLSELNEYNKCGDRSFYCASFLFSYENKNLMYTGDIGSKNDLELFKEFKLDALISEITHITIGELIEKVNILNPSQVYLTHITEDDLPDIIEFLNNLPEKSGEIKLAEDRQIIGF